MPARLAAAAALPAAIGAIGTPSPVAAADGVGGAEGGTLLGCEALTAGVTAGSVLLASVAAATS